MALVAQNHRPDVPVAASQSALVMQSGAQYEALPAVGVHDDGGPFDVTSQHTSDAVHGCSDARVHVVWQYWLNAQT